MCYMFSPPGYNLFHSLVRSGPSGHLEIRSCPPSTSARCLCFPGPWFTGSPAPHLGSQDCAVRLAVGWPFRPGLCGRVFPLLPGSRPTVAPAPSLAPGRVVSVKECSVLLGLRGHLAPPSMATTLPSGTITPAVAKSQDVCAPSVKENVPFCPFLSHDHLY